MVVFQNSCYVVLEGLMAVACGRILEQVWRFFFFYIPLKDLYPDLFACSVSKEAWISDLVFYASVGEVGAGIYNSTVLFMTGS